MKHKEKAATLFNEYLQIVIYGSKAKQCAIIAVNEIINSLNDTDEIDMELITYWQEVLTELNHL